VAKQKKSSFKDKFVGGHFAIERFGILFILLVVLFGMFTTIGFVHSQKQDDTVYRSRRIYTQTFTSSLSKAKGEFLDMWVNEAKTKAFLLLKFDDKTIENISTDANMYRLFVQGMTQSVSKTETLCNPTASIYMLGSSGYMGIMLYEEAGFPLQLLRVTVRLDRNFVTAITKEDVLYREDSATNDQFNIYINPGADNEGVVHTTAFLEEGRSPEALEIYALAASDEDEQEARNALAEDLRQMSLLFLKMTEYESRLQASGIAVPERPELIRGDYIETYLGDELLTMTKKENWVYPEGHTYAGRIISETDEKLFHRVLVSENLIPGGYNFDWWNGNIHDGYLDALRGEKSIAVYLRDNRQAKYETQLSTKDIKWYYENGTEFVYDAELDMAATGAINVNIQTLMDTWNDYYKLKCKYERKDMEALLLLERSLTDVETSCSVNADPANIWIYHKK